MKKIFPLLVLSVLGITSCNIKLPTASFYVTNSVGSAIAVYVDGGYDASVDSGKTQLFLLTPQSHWVGAETTTGSPIEQTPSFPNSYQIYPSNTTVTYMTVTSSSSTLSGS